MNASIIQIVLQEFFRCNELMLKQIDEKTNITTACYELTAPKDVLSKIVLEEIETIVKNNYRDVSEVKPTETGTYQIFLHHTDPLALHAMNRHQEEQDLIKLHEEWERLDKRVNSPLQPNRIPLFGPIVAAIICWIHCIVLLENFLCQSLNLKRTLIFHFPVSQVLQGFLLSIMFGSLFLLMEFLQTPEHHTKK